jgi:hypothetical protein
VSPRCRVPPTPERLRLDALATNYLTVKEAARIAERDLDLDGPLFVDALLAFVRAELVGSELLAAADQADAERNGPRYKPPRSEAA